MRNYFDNLNLRNDIGFKNAIKKIEDTKIKEWKKSSKFYNDKSQFFFNDEKLDFQIRENLKTHVQSSGPTNQRHNKLINQKDKRLKNKSDKNDVYCVNNKQVIKEEKSNIDSEPITLYKEKHSKADLDFNYNIKMEDGQKIENDNFRDLTKAETELNEFHTDLQSLFITMAVNSKAGENEGQSNNCMENFYSVTKHNTQETIQNFKNSNTEISEILCVIPLRTEEQNRYDFLSIKVIKKWKMYIHEKKQVKQREEVLNNFFEKLAEKKSSINQPSDYVKKAKSHIKDFNTYQHRFEIKMNLLAHFLFVHLYSLN